MYVDLTVMFETLHISIAVTGKDRFQHAQHTFRSL